MPNIKIDKSLLQKGSEHMEHEVLDIPADGIKENLIQLGITKSGTTNFENLICPYCHNTVPWNDFYYDVDTMNILDTDAAALGTFICPHCNQEIDVLLAVLVRAERVECNDDVAK